jgi:hypothetical protein
VWVFSTVVAAEVLFFLSIQIDCNSNLWNSLASRIK